MYTIVRGKIPITIDPLFCLLVVIISAYNGSAENGNLTVMGTMLWAVVVIGSVLFHEYGHAFAAMAFGQRASIDLVGFGGVTRRHGPALKSFQDFIVVLSGPLAGMALALFSGILIYLYGSLLPAPLLQLLEISLFANIFWTIINLLPILPLDGGQLLRIVLTAIFGLRGTKIALFLSFFCSSIIAVLFFATGSLLAGSLFMLFTFEGFRSWKNSLVLTEKDEDNALRLLLKNAERDFHHGNFESALHQLKDLRAQTSQGVLFQAATVMMSEILCRQGAIQEALQLLQPLAPKLDTMGLKQLQQLTFATHNWSEAIAIGNRIYKEEPSFNVALTNALSHAILSQATPTIGWLQCALRMEPEERRILERPEFNFIRHTSEFQKL